MFSPSQVVKRGMCCAFEYLADAEKQMLLVLLGINWCVVRTSISKSQNLIQLMRFGKLRPEGTFCVPVEISKRKEIRARDASSVKQIQTSAPHRYCTARARTAFVPTKFNLAHPASW